jgi:hypothetical protein
MGPANVKAQNSRASSTASYLELGASWMAKGELGRAIAINNKYVRSARQPGAISEGRQSLIVREGETILNNTDSISRS